MTSIAPEPSSAEIARRIRRRAQRQIARELRAGTYEPGPVGRASERARQRIAGIPYSRKTSMGKAGWRHASHTTLDAAIAHARRLPARSRVLISARGRTVNYDATALRWITLGPAASPDFYDLPLAKEEMTARIVAEFVTWPREFRVSWV